MGEYFWKRIAFSIVSQQQHVMKHANERHNVQLVQLNGECGAAMLDWI